MAYTPSPDKVGGNIYGSSVNDGNRQALVGVGNRMQTRDGTATPVASPLAMTGSTQTLTVPPNAISITFLPNTASVNVSEDSTMSTYFTIPTSALLTITLARQQYIYLSGTSPDTVEFFFTLV